MAEPARRSGLALALAVGLCAGLALSGGGLLMSGFRTLNRPFDCAGLNAEECAMEQDIAYSWARYQLAFGFGLLSLGAALGLWLWFSERRSTGSTGKE